MTESRQLISNRFEIADPERDLLGRGGMGDVYRGTDLETRQAVAIKALRPEVVSSDPKALARFLREGEALRQLDHHNIVKMVDAVEQDGRHYLVMEYVPGGSLRDLLEGQGRLSIERTVEIALDMADALTRAHRLGILHRDLKPSNVLLAEDGTPRLTDFGYAHLSTGPRLTQTGIVVGTVLYLSPEACRGQTLDARTDIWAFGAMLYEMLTGQVPFPGETLPAVFMAILSQPVPDLSQARPEVSDALADLVYRMLEKDRAQRIPSVRLVGAELEAVSQGSGFRVPSYELQVASRERQSITERRFATPTPHETGAPHNLPAQPTLFVGREETLAEIEERLQDPGCRLLTLVGPGGSGKTRLALEVAARQLGRYPNGVWFVSLAPLQSAEAIVPTIAQAIGFYFHAGSEPNEQLLNYLRQKNLLLVLDNYEHLLEGAELIADILRAAPEVVVLVTSRAGLRLQGEHRFPVVGMSYPTLTPPTEDGRSLSPVVGREELAGMAQYSAVQLFTAGARRAQPGFELTDDNLADVVRICQLVEGMPLALLLAAAWVEMLTPGEIAREMERGLMPEIEGLRPGLGLDFLASDLRDVPERQRSMRAVFDHSWVLLSERERTVMEAMSVFRGGCTREAAQEVTGASLRELMALVDRSLLQRTPAGRYELHELLRQYAAGRLAEHPAEDQAAHDRHAAYYAQLIHSRVDGEIRATAGGGVPEIDNARAGWQWAAHRTRAIWMREFVYGLVQGYQALGWWREGIAFLREAIGTLRAVEPGEDRDMALATALAGDAYLSWMIGESEQVPGIFRESQALLRQLDAQEELALCNLWAAWTTVYPDDVQRKLVEESLAIATRIGRPSLVSQALRIQAYRAMRDGAYDEAQRRGETAFRVSRNAGLLSEMRASLVLLGNVAYSTSDYAKAEQCYREALMLAEELKNRYSMIALRVDLGDVALALGEHQRAREHYEDALARYEEASDHRTHVRILRGFGDVALATGDQVSARDHYRRALGLAAEKTDETSCAGSMIGPSALLARRGKVELATEVLALVLEIDPYPIPVRSAAYRLLGALQSELSPAVFVAAQERGRARDLWATVEELLAELEE